MDPGADAEGIETIAFDPSALLLLAGAWWVLSAIGYGTAVPTGLFVPMIVVGAAIGRILPLRS